MALAFTLAVLVGAFVAEIVEALIGVPDDASMCMFLLWAWFSLSTQGWLDQVPGVCLKGLTIHLYPCLGYPPLVIVPPVSLVV